MSCNSYRANSPYSLGLSQSFSQPYIEHYVNIPNPKSIGVVNTDIMFRTPYDIEMLKKFGCVGSDIANKDQIERVYYPQTNSTSPFVVPK